MSQEAGVRVDFYQLGHDTAENAIPLIARAATRQGERLLVVSEDAAELDRIGAALWQKLPDTFLAHGRAGQGHEARQPILLSTSCNPANGARYLAIADGQWRDGEQPFERTFFFFAMPQLQQARACWRSLGERADVDRRFWRKEAGRWIEGPGAQR